MTGFRAFILSVQAYFVHKQIDVDLDIERGVARPLDPPYASSAFGLQTLTQLCAVRAEPEWPALITTHFDAILAAPKGQNPLDIDMRQLRDHAAHLRVRIYPEDIADYFKTLVARAGPPGTYEVLVLDLPHSVRTVSREEADLWGVGIDALFDLGRRNLAALPPLIAQSLTLPLRQSLVALSGDTYYAASHALFLPRYLPTHARHGALFSIPRRDILLYHVIESIGMIDAAGALMQVTLGMHTEGPGSVSPHLYWHHQNEIVDLPYLIDDGVLHVDAPEAFQALIDVLQSQTALN